MTDGKIWQVMLKLRVFTPWMVLKELNPPSFLRSYAKEKIRSLIKAQTRAGILQVLNEDPPVFSFPGETIEKVKRECKICGEKFIPIRDNHKHCPECIRKRRNKEHKDKRRKYEKEEELIWDILSRHGCKSEILHELSFRLGRKPEAIKSKFMKMKKKRRAEA